MTRCVAVALLACCVACTFPMPGREFHVAPDGTPSGDGSAERPWDLATALAHPAPVSPGDIIWLHGGIYTGTFTSKLAGSADYPILVRQVPRERAVIEAGSSDSDALTVSGESTWFMGFEIRYSDPVRYSSRTGSFPGDIHRGTCVTVNGPRTKLIAMVLHDCSQGVGLWTPAVDAELYGNIIFHNGWNGAGQGHGHGVYTQNDAGVKRVRENIVFNQFGLGMQAYGSPAATVRNYEISGNVMFNNGSIGEAGARVDNLLVAGGAPPKDRINVESNFLYHTPSANSGYSRMGWTWDTANGEIVVKDNYMIGGQPPIGLWYWDQVVFSGNTVYSTGAQQWLVPPKTAGRQTWSGNRYWGNESFRYEDQNLGWDGWRRVRGEEDSRFTSARPSGVWTFVRPSMYERGRAHIVVFNWDSAREFQADLSQVLLDGDDFEIRDAQNFFGPAVAGGQFDGRPVRVPLTGLKVMAPVGSVTTPPQHTAPDFAVFVVLLK